MVPQQMPAENYLFKKVLFKKKKEKKKERMIAVGDRLQMQNIL